MQQESPDTGSVLAAFVGFAPLDIRGDALDNHLSGYGTTVSDQVRDISSHGRPRPNDRCSVGSDCLTPSEGCAYVESPSTKENHHEPHDHPLQRSRRPTRLDRDRPDSRTRQARHLARRRIPRSIHDRTRPHRAVRPLERVRRQSPIHDRTTLSTICGFYKYCSQERLIERDPSAHVRRPKQDYESSTLGLDRNELGAFLVQAGLCGGRDHALACLLALNGLRISEALGADIDNLDVNRGHRTLFIHRKGNKTATIPLSPRTARALDLYIGEREAGPIFMNHDGKSRLDRHASARIVRRLTKAAGIDKRISPHSLRHSFITAALDAGVPLRDVQEAASHSDPRTTMRYDRGRGSLDRHPTYIVSTFVAGASR